VPAQPARRRVGSGTGVGEDLGQRGDEVGDAARGWAFGGPFDVIVLTGSLPMLPDAFQKQLKRGGRLFAIVGERPVMSARLIVRESDTAFGAVTLFETVVDPLRNAQQPKRFVF